MMYGAEIHFDGSQYHGWQHQSNAISIQDVIESKIAQLLQQPIRIVGCGRTDTGVHARSFFFHFESAKQCSQDVFIALNKILPQSIGIKKTGQVAASFHARFSAISRLYRYYIHKKKNPFLTQHSYFLPYNLNLDKMNEACKYLIAERSFKCFCKAHNSLSNYHCKIFKAHWKQIASQTVFEIRANRFLRGMVRSIVGSMIDIGSNKATLDWFAKVIDSQDRSQAGDSVPATGLFLEDVKYPKDCLINLKMLNV